MMPSSAASQHRQREDTHFEQDTAPTSFFTKVKSYLTAPFSWLMGTNDERDDAGQQSPATPSELRETERAQVPYQAYQSPSPASTVTRPFVSTPTASTRAHLSASTSAQPFTSPGARPPASTYQPFAFTRTQPPGFTRAQPSILTRTQPFALTRTQPSASTSVQPSTSTSAHPSALIHAQPSMSAHTQPSVSTNAQPSAPTSVYERDGLGKRKRTTAVSTEIKEQEEEGGEGEGEEGEDEIQYSRRKSPEFKRRKYKLGSNALRSIYGDIGKLSCSVPWPGPESLVIHKPTDSSVSLGPVLPPVGIIRTFERGETVSESRSLSGTSENTVTSVTPATLTRPSPFAEPEIYQLYLKCMAPPKNPDWIDMISMEFLQNHPAFVKPPPDRHGVPVWETIGENPSIDELLASKQGKEWREYMQRIRQEKVNRENNEREEFLRQKKILKAQAKAQAKADHDKLAAEHNKLKAFEQEYLEKLFGKPISFWSKPNLPSPDLPPNFLSSQDGSPLTQDDLLDWNGGGKKLQQMLEMRVFSKKYQAEFKRLNRRAKRRAQRVNRISASNSVPTDMTVEVTEVQPSTSMTDVEAARVRPSAPVLQSVAVQTMEARPLTSVTNEVEVEAARIQPSTSVPNDPTSEVANIQIPMSMSNDAIVEATNAQPSLPSPKDVSVESGRHYSPMSVDVSLESGRHYSPMSVDVSMESTENVLLSPSISSTSGASSLRVGHVKSSRNRTPRPYTIRSRARSPAEGDRFIPDRDKEMAMLEEAAKNVPDFNLPANFSFTENTQPTQGSTTFVSNPVPLHAASSISSLGANVNPFVPSLPIEDPANPLWDGEKKTENAQRDQDFLLGQQAYAPAGSMSCGVNDSSSSQLTLPDDSDQDCQMDVSPPNNRSTSSGIGSEPFDQSSGQTSQGAGSFHPSTPGPFGQHSGGPASSNSFTAPGFFASGSGSNQPTLVPFSGPNSFPSGVPFEANANQFNPDPNQFNQFNTNQSNPIESNPNSFNQSNTTSFNQFNPNQYNPNQPNPTEFNPSNFNQFNQFNTTSFNQFNATSFNQPNPNQFNQPAPNQFNQSTPSQFNQSTPSQFNQSTPNQFNQSTPSQFNQSMPSQFNQSTPNQFNPSALSSPSASLASTPVVFTIGAPPPVKLDRHGRPVKNKSGRPTKKLPQRNRMKQ